MRGPELAGPVASPLDGGFGRARIPEDSGSTTRLGGGGWRGGGSCVLRSSSVALRYGSGEKKPAFQCWFSLQSGLSLILRSVRGSRQEPTRRRAGGSILRHIPGHW